MSAWRAIENRKFSVFFSTFPLLVTFTVLGAASGSFLPEAVVWYIPYCCAGLGADSPCD